MKITLALLMVGVILYLFFSINKNAGMNNMQKLKIADGIYSCETINNPGYFKLTIKDTTFNFQHIVSIHLPPNIIEEVNGVLEHQNSNFFVLDPSPKAINAQINFVDSETISATDSVTRTIMTLKKHSNKDE